MKAGKPKSTETIVTGTVVKKNFGGSSKSEHEAICLETKTVSYKLTLMGANPFHDDRLEKLVGRQVTVRGRVTDYLLIATEVNVES